MHRNMLDIQNLCAAVDGRQILNGLSLRVQPGETHAIMGPNGSGKSTLAATLAGKGDYEVTGGSVSFNGADLLEMKPEERARAGVFLAFQYPVEIPGVNSTYFLKAALNECRKARGESELDAVEFLALVKAKTKLAVLDETDSGLDIDALRIVSGGVNKLRRPDNAALVITHYQRLLNYIVPDFVHVLVNGQIVKSGGKELALELEQRGYDWILEKTAAMAV